MLIRCLIPSFHMADLMIVFNILGLHLHIGRIVRHDPHDGALGAEAKASRGHDINAATQAVISNLMDEVVYDFQAVRAIACRTAATEHLDMIGTGQAVGLLGTVRRLRFITCLDQRLVAFCIHWLAAI